MAYPTTLALITALWAPGPGRTRSIALWSALGGAIAALGPLVSGFLLERFEWGSVFLVTLPLAVGRAVMAWRFVPAHVNETTEAVDNLGGILSALLVGTLILAINFAPGARTWGPWSLGLAIIAIAAAVAFVIRQRRAANPLYDLDIAARPTFWVAAVAGIIVFGSLMGAMFIGQQYLQNVLGYSTFEAGAAILRPRSDGPGRAALGHARRGARRAVHAAARLRLRVARVPHDAPALGGGQPVLAGRAGLRASSASASASPAPPRHIRLPGPCRSPAPAWLRARPTCSATSAARSCSPSSERCSPPATRRRAAAIAGAPRAPDVTDDVQNELTKSFSSAADIAAAVPAVRARSWRPPRVVPRGDQWAYPAGIIAVLLGAGSCLRCSPPPRTPPPCPEYPARRTISRACRRAHRHGAVGRRACPADAWPAHHSFSHTMSPHTHRYRG